MITDDGSGRLGLAADEYRREVLDRVQQWRAAAAAGDEEAVLGELLDGLADVFEQKCRILMGYQGVARRARLGWPQIVALIVGHPDYAGADDDEARGAAFVQLVNALAWHEIPLCDGVSESDRETVWQLANEAYWTFRLVLVGVLAANEFDPPDFGSALGFVLGKLKEADYGTDLLVLGDPSFPPPLRDRAAVRLTGIVVNHMRLTGHVAVRLVDAVDMGRKEERRTTKASRIKAFVEGERAVSRRHAFLRAAFHALLEVSSTVGSAHVPLVSPPRALGKDKSTAGRGAARSLVSEVGREIVRQAPEPAAKPGKVARVSDADPEVTLRQMGNVQSAANVEREAIERVEREDLPTRLTQAVADVGRNGQQLADLLLLWLDMDVCPIAELAAAAREGLGDKRTTAAVYKQIERLSKLSPDDLQRLEAALLPP